MLGLWLGEVKHLSSREAKDGEGVIHENMDDDKTFDKRMLNFPFPGWCLQWFEYAWPRQRHY